jgi:nucleolar protein 12
MSGGLFAKSSVIDNEKLVSEKQRTVVQLKKKERKEKKRQERKEQENATVVEDEEKTEEKENQDEEQDVDTAEKMDIDDDNADLEDRYMSKLLEEEDDDEEEEGEDDASEDEAKSVHGEEKIELINEGVTESTEDSEEKTETKQRKASAAKILDLKDKEFEKAERTIFIGNVPSIIMSNKRETKDFKQFINKILECPENSSLIESIRFRSIHSTTTAPRKVAFIAKDVDLENVMNCYVVFKKKEDSLNALKMNGTVYKDHHLRLDHLTHPTKKDNKLSVFVGNLDFQAHEESLWKYFNDKLITKEEKKDTKNVIDNVRIVRDSKTSFGKGFAIIQFMDTNYVSKALLLDGKKMGKRSLRITRCKKPLRNNENMRLKFSKLNDKQKTVVGRAKQLGKIDRRTLGKMVVEGERATKGKTNPIGGVGKKRHGGRKERRENKARITKRSQAFKDKIAKDSNE